MPVVAGLLAAAGLAAAAAVSGCDGAPPEGEGGAGGSAGCAGSGVAGPDGACIQAGLDGCAEVFIGPDGQCVPTASACLPGTVPSFAAGCQPAGIQGCAPVFVGEDGVCRPSADTCPAGTIPRFSTGCEPVGVAGCAPEHLDADGRCRPAVDACAQPGTFPTPQDGCVEIDPSGGCGPAPWGDLPDGPPTIHVDPTYVGGDGDGSPAKPLTTVAAALAAVPAGGRVVLAAGAYEEPVTITKPVEIRGRCASMVEISGIQAYQGKDLVVRVAGKKEVKLTNLSIHGEGWGVLADVGTGLTLDHVRIHDTRGLGMNMGGPTTSVTVLSSVVEGVRAYADETGGGGIHVYSGADLTLERVALRGNRRGGLYAGGGGSTVTMTNVLVSDTLPQMNNQQQGAGVFLDNGSSAIVTDAVIADNRYVGLVVSGPGTDVTVTRSVIAGTLPRASDQAYGYGALVIEGAQATFDAAVIVDNRRYGVAADGAATQLAVTGTLIAGTLTQQSDDTAGHGVYLQEGATGTVTDSALVGHHGRGIRVSHAQGTLASSLVQGTLSSPNDNVGVGAAALAGGALTVESSAILYSHGVGVLGDSTDLPGSTLVVRGSLIAGTVGGASGAYGRGLFVQAGATAEIDACLLLDNHEVGAGARDVGTSLQMRGSLVAGTRGLEDTGMFGRGLEVGTGAQATLTDSALLANRDIGLHVIGLGTIANVTGLLVEGTLPNEAKGELGAGVLVSSGGSLTMSAASIIDSHVAGVVASGSGAVTIDRVVVRGVEAGNFTLFSPTETIEQAGDGVLAVRGSTVLLSRTFLLDCARAGALFDDSGGELSEVAAIQNRYGLALQGAIKPSYTAARNVFSPNLETSILEGDLLAIPDAPTELPSL